MVRFHGTATKEEMPPDKEITGFFRVLSWTKIWQSLVILVLLVSGIAIWDNRAYLYSKLMPGKISANTTHITELSSKSKEQIKDILDKTKKNYIIAIHVTSVNFQKNTRKVIYFDSNNSDFDKLFEDFNKKAVTELPLFTADTAGNRRIIDMINGEFLCFKFTESVAFRVEPRTGDYAKTMCIIGIPPYYGKFNGIIAVYLAKELTPTDVAEIRIVIQDLANKIFENDVIKK